MTVALLALLLAQAGPDQLVVGDSLLPLDDVMYVEFRCASSRLCPRWVMTREYYRDLVVAVHEGGECATQLAHLGVDLAVGDVELTAARRQREDDEWRRFFTGASALVVGLIIGGFAAYYLLPPRRP